MPWPSYRRLILFVVALVMMLGVAPAAEALTNTQSAQKALDFVTADAVNWTQSHGCVACHRQAGPVFAASKANANGYDLSVITSNGRSVQSNLSYLAQYINGDQQPGGYWIYQGGYWPYGKSSYASFGLAGYDQYVNTQYSNSLVTFANWAIASQGSSGGWGPDSYCSYPVLWGNVGLTGRIMVAIAQAMQRVDPTTAQQYQSALDRGAAYLRNNMGNMDGSCGGNGMPYNNLVAWAIVGLQAAGPGASGENTAAINTLSNRLLAQTSSPTGAAWGQTSGAGADPTNTGTVLYALCLAGLEPGSSPTLQNAINWLKTQQASDGSFNSGGMIDISTTFAELGLSCFGDYSVNVYNVGATSQLLASGSPDPQTVSYTFDVHNHGYLSDVYGITVQGVPGGWSASVDSPSVALPPGADATVTLTVTAPPNLFQSMSIPLTLTATSVNAPTVNASARVTTYTDPPPPTTGLTSTTALFTPAANTTAVAGQPINLAATVALASTGQGVDGPSRGVVNFYVAGYAVGSDNDADGDGIYSVTWTPDPATWTATGAQDFRAVYSGVTLDAPLENILGSVASETIYVHVPATPLLPVSGSDPGFPAAPYPYASAAITAVPYPPTQGQPVTLGAMLKNPTLSPVTFTSVDFYISNYGLGLTWQKVGSVANVLLPGGDNSSGVLVPGSVHPTIQWTPPFSGHHCARVVLTYADGHTQTVQRNLDILGVSSGSSQGTTFQVGNPTDQTATITLVLVPVAQSPQGWTASLGQTSITLAPGAFSNISLTITPPPNAPPGSFATYNVEGYIGSTLIGGVSKTVVIGGLPAPTVKYPPAGAYLPGTFVIQGTALPYAYVSCTAGSYVFETLADGSGNFSLPVTMASGGYTLSITQEVGGVTSASAGGGIPITVVGSGVPPVGNFTLQGVPQGGTTRVDTLIFSGTGLPGDTVALYSTDPATGLTREIGSTAVGADGRWTFLSAPQPDGAPTFTAVQVDPIGNQSPSSSGYPVLIDTLPPTIVISGVQQCGTSGTGTAVTPTISVSDLNAAGTTAATSGVNPQSVVSTLNGQSYSSGTPITQAGWYTLVVTAADQAGNSTTQTVQFSIGANQAPAASWTPTTDLPAQRVYHSATALPSGKVLVVGGWSYDSYLATTVLYDPLAGTWSSTGPLATARQAHTATLLNSGKVLIAGGEVSVSNPDTATAELYDPSTGTWSSAGALSQTRAYSAAVLLPSGRVLVAGGVSQGGYWATVDVYNPSTGSWSSAAPMLESRRSHTATLLPSGKVLVVGGYAGVSSGTAELYDPGTNTWSYTGALLYPRYNHTATLLPSGQVLVTGGQNETGTLASAELYDPASGIWSSVSDMASARALHTATLVSGMVLVAGGLNSGALAAAELFDPATGTWTPTASLGMARDLQTATLLPSINKVLVTGGWNGSPLTSAELFDPGAAVCGAAGNAMVMSSPSASMQRVGTGAGLRSASPGAPPRPAGVYRPISAGCSAGGSGGPMVALALLLIALLVARRP